MYVLTYACCIIIFIHALLFIALHIYLKQTTFKQTNLNLIFMFTKLRFWITHSTHNRNIQKSYSSFFLHVNHYISCTLQLTKSFFLNHCLVQRKFCSIIFLLFSDIYLYTNTISCIYIDHRLHLWSFCGDQWLFAEMYMQKKIRERGGGRNLSWGAEVGPPLCRTFPWVLITPSSVTSCRQGELIGWL